ncbi:MAG: glutamate-1-semialdehyde 2,1-aminomutase [Kiritimatiellia bacterium]
MDNPSSADLFKRACRVIPGGVNSPVRAFGAVGGAPVFMASGRGAKLTTVDGKRLTDYCGSWGPLILGHAHPKVAAAVRRAAGRGMSFGACTRAEVELAELLCEKIPYLEMVRLVNSGTEAAMTAIRLARGFTGRNKILKFDGCYHGHADSMLVSAGSGLLTGGIASSAGIPPGVVADVLVAPYNDLAAVARHMERDGQDIAAVIVEPVAGNMGLVPPDESFLDGLRKMTRAKGTLLIFDEVISGFRLGPTTYGALCGITPDLTCLGKIIGGGMPLGALGGRAKIMRLLAPLGAVYQAGTLSGNPVAVAAGFSTLNVLIEENPYRDIARRGKRVADAFKKRTLDDDGNAHCANLGGMFTVYFRAPKVRNLADAKRCDTARYAAFFHGMLKRGIYLPPSQFEVCFVSAAHTDGDIDRFLNAADEALAGHFE